jgi:hypothetical protein
VWVWVGIPLLRAQHDKGTAIRDEAIEDLPLAGLGCEVEVLFTL